MRNKLRKTTIAIPLAIIFLAFSEVAIAQQPAPQLSLPLDCQPQKTCFIQNYVDIDPTDAVRGMLFFVVLWE